VIITVVVQSRLVQVRVHGCNTHKEHCTMRHMYRLDRNEHSGISCGLLAFYRDVMSASVCLRGCYGMLLGSASVLFICSLAQICLLGTLPLCAQLSRSVCSALSLCLHGSLALSPRLFRPSCSALFLLSARFSPSLCHSFSALFLFRPPLSRITILF
jgi:hypothetical protein